MHTVIRLITMTMDAYSGDSATDLCILHFRLLQFHTRLIVLRSQGLLK